MDIIEFIHDSGFRQLLSSEFTSDDQKLFVQSFTTYLQYGNDDTKFVINFDDVWKWVGYTRKDTAKDVLEKYFQDGLDYTREVFRSVPENPLGGRPKQNIFLNVATFKDFCMKADTSKGHEIRKYYIKMERILFNFIQNRNREMIKAIETNAEKKIEINKHNVFKRAYKNRPVVYLIRLGNEEDGYIILKIGSTRDIYDRISKIEHDFGCEAVILDIFECEDNEKFETFLHNHPVTIPFKFKFAKPNQSKSIETYKINSIDTYNKFVHLIERNIVYYKEKSMEAKVLNIKSMEVAYMTSLLDLYKNNPDGFQTFITATNNKNVNSESITQEISAIQDDIDASTSSSNVIVKSEKRPCGDKVQVYHYKDLSKVLYVIDGITEATRMFPHSSYSQIQNAVNEKFNYLGFRWHFIDKNDPEPFKPRDIGESSDRNCQSGLIAQLNKEKTTIQAVFNNVTEASKHVKLVYKTMIDAVDNEKELKESYWCYWYHLSDSLKESYLTHSKLPEKKAPFHGKKIELCDPDTKQVMNIFSSIDEVKKQFNMSPKSIKKYCEEQTIKNGFLWKFAT